ncbi:IS3 family transposase [Fusibacter tunisiensis]|uniref:Transposase n=1 Tax=Fusibacter tunisiensis TaxID=1008308 RepID=A0ABS2MU52_9FIRM|nr:IS3 family transposase [Fusibacter tunisiensis]MBM7562880.1 putative transposase [Fusibacter tunisiensis]
MISREDRVLVIELIDEAVTNGAREFKACEVLNISHRTLFRWRSKNTPDEDQRPYATRPEPSNKLTKEEKERIIEVVNSPEYKSLPPSQIVPSLADKGEYIASESTMYKVLKEYNMQHHRGLSKAPVKRSISTHYADGPNQVWMWDITYIPAGIKGKYHYLYLILDLYSRKIIAWEIYEKESAEYASKLVRRAFMCEHRTKDMKPLVLHSDNGSPMKGATLLETLIMLGVMPSNSRPRVSNDNAYAESVFKTLKYRPGYPRKGLSTIEDARNWVLQFARWYNQEHRHSGLNFLTPEQRHNGLGETVLANRKAVYEAAKLKNPNRWSRNTRKWDLEERVWLNPESDGIIETIEEKSS